MSTQPQIEETDLIRIKAIKAKHLNQILQPIWKDPSGGGVNPIQTDELEFLGYAPGPSAVLARHKANGHFIAFRTNHLVGCKIEEARSTGQDWDAAQAEANSFIESLPQLFVKRHFSKLANTPIVARSGRYS
jgi:hypothetical protein